MWLLMAAVVLAVLKALVHLEVVDVAGIAAMSWWWVLGGFAVTMAWFTYADQSGLTKRKAMEKMDKRKQERLDKQRELLTGRRKR
ncbi:MULTISPECIES: TIGR04438 family Trp-rich protein [Comamonas]|jgi:small Trp-rich protein|uniref:TIGR04438 family Trp-rich protein n=1 Tax=Comamonas avium TaxID=2762231 RepID=A0ABR8SD35_9BURK|nr:MULTISPECIES: TIGR04438 family Trp-rich protein [Comamonas]MBD7961388.1 TIGR04438 family Trp-rich protein [Comamonas avium]MBD9401969.1 TIGR04438 family Trp-rich protein [Comamonas sp. CMM02]